MRRIVSAVGVLVVPATFLVAPASPAEEAACTVVGTPRDDVLRGTPRADVICGRGGDDVLQGRGGDDVLRGGRGEDTLLPGRGANEVHGQDGNDTVRYDRLSSGHVSVDLVSGTVGGAVTDRLVGVENAVGTHRADSLVGSGASNRLSGRRGDDAIVPGKGDDVAKGGAGNDTLSYANVNMLQSTTIDLRSGVVTGAPGSDTTPGFENVTGSPRPDTIWGTDGANVIDAGDGLDHVYPGLGDDVVDAGFGEYVDRDHVRGDVLGYGDVTTIGVVVDLTAGTVSGPGSSTVEGFEQVRGTVNDDTLIGDEEFNELYGGDGDDTIEGRGHTDILGGGAGDDLIVPGPSGGTGDQLQYSYGDSGHDAVSFAEAQSQIWAVGSGNGWDVDYDAGYYINSLQQVEVLHGTPHADDLHGGLGTLEVTIHGMGGTDDINTVDGHGGDTIHAPPGSGSACVGDPGDIIDC